MRESAYMWRLKGYTVLDMNQDWFDKDGQLESFVTETHISTGKAGQSQGLHLALPRREAFITRS